MVGRKMLCVNVRAEWPKLPTDKCWKMGNNIKVPVGDTDRIRVNVMAADGMRDGNNCDACRMEI